MGTIPPILFCFWLNSRSSLSLSSTERQRLPSPSPFSPPFSDLLQYVHVSVRTGVQGVSHQCRGEGSPPSACWQYFVCCSPGGHWSSLLQGQISVSWLVWCAPGPPAPIVRAVFQLLGTQHILVHGVAPCQMQDFPFPRIEFHEVPVNTLIQPVEVSLNGSTIP